MVEKQPSPPSGTDEHMFGVRGGATPAPAPDDPATSRERKLHDLAMSQAEWARRYAESQG